MPGIRFADLPRLVWQHLLLLVEQRKVSLADLGALQAWVRTEPYAPEGDWYKQRGSFILCGPGEYPKTILTREMQPYGTEIR